MPKNPKIDTKSIVSLIEYGCKLLTPCSDSAKLDAQILLCLVLNKECSYLLTWPEKELSPQYIEQYLSLLARRFTGEPIAYITGVKEFWSLSLAVSTATLIPRPDTETLVELVLDVFAEQSNINCLDLGTGTGAIALALAFENPSWKIDAVDFNIEAVNLAQQNAKNLNLPQVNIYQSDWFSAITTVKKFDLIVSNPPYIDSDDKNLNCGDVRFEPKSALVANEQGLADIKHIAKNAQLYLVDQGKLFFEHGFDQALPVQKILTDLGYKQVQTVKDLNNQDRITWAVFKTVIK